MKRLLAAISAGVALTLAGCGTYYVPVHHHHTVVHHVVVVHHTTVVHHVTHVTHVTHHTKTSSKKKH